MKTFTSPALSGLPGLRHAFFTRDGGVSKGIYAGLNGGLGSNDDADDVAENRKRMAEAMGVDVAHFLTVHQIHSPDVAVATTPWDVELRPRADAMVTGTPGIALGVTTADCGPILFADAENRVIGAAHAGWKGALTGVLENTLDAMVKLGATREKIVACLGPSISRESYEVGPEFVERFVAQNPDYIGYFTASTKPGHMMFDLPALTLDRLRAAGVRAESLGLCTYPDSERFFSYRRTTHRQEPDYGRQISAIAIMEI